MSCFQHRDLYPFIVVTLDRHVEKCHKKRISMSTDSYIATMHLVTDIHTHT